MNDNPKVFISHASEDKERFVMDFATKLRAKGIDAWLDKWEMLPGDSLVEKIFEEGIKNSKAFIIILSRNSVNKPWVREELNAGMVRKINGISKTIPVIIDDCEVPEALKSLLWESISDLSDYDIQLERIVKSIFEERGKPPLGEIPAYAQSNIDIIPSLSATDSLVLKVACEEANIRGHKSIISPESVLKECIELDINEFDFYESLEILDSRGYIRGKKTHDGTDRIRFFSITIFGYESYAGTYLNDFEKTVRLVIAEIVNLGKRDTLSISASLNQPVRVVNHIVEVFESRGYLKFVKSKMGDNKITIFNISAELKRKLLS